MNERKIGIVIDSTFNHQYAKKLFSDISIVPIQIIVDNNVYDKGNISNQQLLQFMQQKKKIHTSQPSPELFLKAFQKQFDLGYEKVICLTLSTKLSGSFNSANLAKNMLENPKIKIFNTETVGPGNDYILKEIHHYFNKNKSLTDIDNIINNILKKQKKGFIYFTVDNLKYLVSQGRISKIKAFIGNFLKIKPILEVKDGVVSITKKVRSQNKCFRYLIDKIKEQQLKYNNIEIFFQYVTKTENVLTFEKELKSLKNEKTKIYSSEFCYTIIVNLGIEAFGYAIYTS